MQIYCGNSYSVLSRVFLIFFNIYYIFQIALSPSKTAVVSPMPPDPPKDPPAAPSLCAQLSESSHSASTGQHSNSSESSVIYRPSSESGSERAPVPPPVIPNRMDLPKGYLNEEKEDVNVNTNSVKVMEDS